MWIKRVIRPMSIYRFIKIVLFFSCVFLLITCGELFGPAEVNENSGTTGDVDEWLLLADEIYRGASGTTKKENLNKSLTIYRNLLSRSDLSTQQRIQTARGYSRTYQANNIRSLLAILKPFVDFMYELSDSTNFTVSRDVSQALKDTTAGLTTVMDHVIVVVLEHIPSQVARQADHINVTLLSGLALGNDLGNFFFTHHEIATDLLAISDEIEKFNSNYALFTNETSTELQQAEALSNCVTYRSSIFTLTNSVNKAENSSRLVLSNTSNRIELLNAYGTNTSSITDAIISAMEEVTNVLTGVVSVFDSLNDSDSILRQFTNT